MTDIDPAIIQMYRENATIIVDVTKVGVFKWNARVYDDFGFFDVSTTVHSKKAAKAFVVDRLAEVEETLGGSLNG